MTHEHLSALLAFALVTSITPGPNNLMLMASGATFGLRRTVPHMVGIGVGFMVLVAMVGAGLAELLATLPGADAALKGLSVGYLLFLAWKVATAAPPGQAETGAAGAGRVGGRPMTFLGAAAFQWVNPKAWAMALTAVGAYAPSQSPSAIALVAAVFGAVNLPSVSLWAVAGQGMRALLMNPGRRRVFNVTMAVLLVASLYPILAR